MLFIVGIAGIVVFYNIEKRVKNPLVSVEYQPAPHLALLLTTLLTMTGVFAVMNGLLPTSRDKPMVWACPPVWCPGGPRPRTRWLSGLRPDRRCVGRQFGYKIVLQIGTH